MRPLGPVHSSAWTSNKEEEEGEEREEDVAAEEKNRTRSWRVCADAVEGELKCGVPRHTARGSLSDHSASSSMAAMAAAASGRDLIKGSGQDQKPKCGMGKYGAEGPLRAGSAGREYEKVLAVGLSWWLKAKMVSGISSGEGDVKRAR